MTKIVRLTENQFGEMMAYHGSIHDFDKFNHKKYLNTGAGSQTFGWGTYVTNDIEIANGYKDVSVNVQDIDRNDLINKISESFGIDINDAQSFVERFYKLMNGYNLPKRNGAVSYRELLGYGFKQEDIDKIKFIVSYVGENSNVLYEVEIPDDNDENYIDWYLYGGYNTEKIKKGVFYLKKRFNFLISNRLKGMLNTWLSPPGEKLYNELCKNLGSPKAASLFLLHCGFDGIKYPAGTRWKKPNGASEDAMNYVIFDANKVKIINKTRI